MAIQSLTTISDVTFSNAQPIEWEPFKAPVKRKTHPRSVLLDRTRDYFLALPDAEQKQFEDVMETVLKWPDEEIEAFGKQIDTLSGKKKLLKLFNGKCTLEMFQMLQFEIKRTAYETYHYNLRNGQVLYFVTKLTDDERDDLNNAVSWVYDGMRRRDPELYSRVLADYNRALSKEGLPTIQY